LDTGAGVPAERQAKLMMCEAWYAFVPAADRSYDSVLYEDDGLTFAFREGANYRTTFTLTKAATLLTLHATVVGEGYVECARQAFNLVFHGAAPAAVRVNDQDVLPLDGQFIVPNTATNFQLDVELA